MIISWSTTIDKTHIVYEDGYLVMNGVLSDIEVKATPKVGLLTKAQYEAIYPNLTPQQVQKLKQ